MADDRVVDFPTLGFLIADWIAAHRVHPDGTPQVLCDDELWSLVCRARIDGGKVAGDLSGEGGNAPIVFAGFAEPGDVYHCGSHGCACDWWYEFVPGEPMGVPVAVRRLSC